MTDEIRASGKRMTRTRQAVLGLLESTKYPLSPSELYARLKKQNVAIDLVTVYRNLHALKAIGVVRQIKLHQEEQFRYEMEEGREHHHHIRCKSCGKIEDLLLCPLKKLTALIEQETRFLVGDHSLEFSGWCPKCQ
ncbi:MAG: transcriptional repressor [Nitrospira sp.]|nr:transcriptional repressor [Nitrospira sp.]